MDVPPLAGFAYKQEIRQGFQKSVKNATHGRDDTLLVVADKLLRPVESAGSIRTKENVQRIPRSVMPSVMDRLKNQIIVLSAGQLGLT